MQREIEWLCQPEAAALVQQCLDEFVAVLPAASALSVTLLTRTGSSLADWVDHVILADGERLRGELVELGFEPEPVQAEEGDTVYHHSGTILPRLLLRKTPGRNPGDVLAVALLVEEIRSFMMAHHLSTPIEGTPLSPLRRARAWGMYGVDLLVVERRGHAGFVPQKMPTDYPQRYLSAFERWASRPRRSLDEQEGMDLTLKSALALVNEFGVDTAAWIAFAAEREHWQQRNRAGQVQKARQDSLGMGWANHDHHTFRSSRQAFPVLIQILEAFGFVPRERFYAGAQAGWGAQVMEQPVCRLAVFADVDLSPDEVEGDFAHRPLAPRDELGTVGLWCALHGEAMLDAGLHHLAARLSFDAATAGLAEWGIKTMRPFSDFSYLRQAFTQGEMWPIAAGRLERLAQAGRISEAQVKQFVEKGAIGSHLENIQRGEGFKGFNQTRISDIIRRTDPRASLEAA